MAWTGTTWFIEGDISGCFDRLDRQVMLDALEPAQSRDVAGHQIVLDDASVLGSVAGDDGMVIKVRQLSAPHGLAAAHVPGTLGVDHRLENIHDNRMLRLASYFPFNVTCYFNGHSFAAQELSRAGVRFRKGRQCYPGRGGRRRTPGHRRSLERCAVAATSCAYWVRRLVPTFSPAERAALQPGYRYSMVEMELATDLVFKRSAPLKALFQRACELGVLVGGAERTTHLLGRRIDRRY